MRKMLLKFRKKHFIFSLFGILAAVVVYLDNHQLTIRGAIIVCILGAGLGYFVLLPFADRLLKTLDQIMGVENLRKILEKDRTP